MHANIIKVVLNAESSAHLLNEIYFLEGSLLINHEYHILIGSRLIMEACPDVVGKRVNAGVWLGIKVPRVCQIERSPNLCFKQETDIDWHPDLCIND